MGKRLRGGLDFLDIPAVSIHPEVREPFRPSRRKMLLGMTALSASAAMAGFPGLSRAASPPQAGRVLWSMTKALFVELAAWYIKEEKMNFSDFCQEQKINRQEWDLIYCRNINDTQEMRRGYGLKRRGGIGSDLKGATQFIVGDNG